MTEFGVAVNSSEFDPGLCLRSGQVFRFDQDGSDRWFGVEGSNWYRIERTASVLRVGTNSEEAAFTSFARLDWDAKAVSAEIVRRGPEMAPYLEAMPGLRILRQSDPVETLFTFLCTANNHVARIATMVRTLASYGDKFAGTELYRFPELERLAEVSEGELRSQGFGYRGAWIAKTASELMARGGRGYLLGLKNATYREAHAELVSLTGIGPKLADCIALFGLDQSSAVPVDTHIWQAMTRLYFPQYAGTSLTPLKYREVADYFRSRFGEHAGWAHQFLFYENHLNWRERKAAGRS